MHFVGVDLAWAGRQPTGLAVLDHRGRLVHLASAVSDEQILAELAPWSTGSVVIGLDAPLAVVNPTGSRPAEAALGRDFARFDAGAHPVNTGRPGFESSPRGARIARALDAEVGGHGARRAVEVYPHPATVALFRLGRVLKYKQKQGRAFELVRGELLRLTELLEGMDAKGTRADPPLRLRGLATWDAVVERVRSATRKSELRPAEDEVDAVVCAYVAQLVARSPGSLTTYGDPATGEIVTPTLPDGLVPAPRVKTTKSVAAQGEKPTSQPDVARAAVDAYAARYDELTLVTDAFVEIVTGQLDDAGINYLSVTGRTKSVSSFAGKAVRLGADGTPLYDDPLTDITDQVGLRVITYLREDVDAVADLLSDEYVVLDDRDMGRETAQEGRFGYASRHLLVTTADSAPLSVAAVALQGRAAQVQIRTVLQHAWAEFEHDIRYKGSIPQEHVSDLDRRFTLAAGLLELADQEFSAIRTRLQGSQGELGPEDALDPRIAAPDLATFLGSRFVDAGWSRTDHYEWISGLLLELGITSLEELGEVLGTVDTEQIDERMGYRYPPGAVRRLDDALLARYGERYGALTGNAHRVDLLRTRLDRLRAD